MHEHSEGHARQSFHVIGVFVAHRWRCGRGGRAGAQWGETKRSRCLQRGDDLLDVRAVWVVVEIMQMRRSVKQSWNQADRRHFGTKITEMSSESRHTT